MERVEHGVRPGGGRADRGEQRAQHAHGRHRDREVVHPRRLERLAEQLQDLGVALGARRADALDADLGDLARGGAHLALRLAEHALLVAEAERSRLARQARRAHARDLQRDVGTHREQIALRVEELERNAGHMAARAHHVHHLERGRLDGSVAPRREQVAHRDADALALGRLLRQNVAEPRRRHHIHSLRFLSS